MIVFAGRWMIDGKPITDDMKLDCRRVVFEGGPLDSFKVNLEGAAFVVDYLMTQHGGDGQFHDTFARYFLKGDRMVNQLTYSKWRSKDGPVLSYEEWERDFNVVHIGNGSIIWSMGEAG